MENLELVSCRLDPAMLERIEKFRSSRPYWKRNAVINNVLTAVLLNADDKTIYDLCRWSKSSGDKLEISVEIKEGGRSKMKNGFMKRKIRFLVIFGLFLGMCCADLSCGSKYFLINSEGIATYNKQTGQFEIAWDTKTHSNQVVHDTVYVDSCQLRK